MALPNLPTQGRTPWFTPRNNWDLAVKAELEGRLSETSLTQTINNQAVKGSVRGAPDRNYSMYLGTIRNDGSPGYFQTIEDAGHRSTFIQSVETLADRVRLNYSPTATKVGTFFAKPDEALKAAGFTCGESVGTNSVDIFIYRAFEVADYVFYNGSSWVSQSGFFTGLSFSGGTLTLTHASLLSNVLAFGVSATPRGGTYLVNADGAGQTTMTVQFRDWTGALITTPDTNMRAYVRHGMSRPVLMNPQLLTTTAFPFSNLWLYGVNEVS